MATSTTNNNSRVHQLAKRLEGDIRRRGLVDGDQYLTAAQAGEMMVVSTTMAQRALRILAEKKILVRRRNAGTFVGPGLEEEGGTIVRNIHVLLSEGTDTKLVRPDQLMDGIRAAIPGVGVNFNFMPVGEEIRYVRELLDTSEANRKAMGVVVCRATRDVYRTLAEIGVPTVVFGMLWPGEPSLPSISYDEHEMGRLLTQYLIDRKHRRMALLSHQGWPGDNDFFDGVSEAFTKAELPHNAMILRAVPHETSIFSAAARDLLEMPDRPTAIIVRGSQFAKIVSQTAESLGLSAPEDVEIVFQDFATKQVEYSPYPHVQTKKQFEEIALQIGQMLNVVSQGQLLEKPKVTLPVKLCLPVTEKDIP